MKTVVVKPLSLRYSIVLLCIYLIPTLLFGSDVTNTETDKFMDQKEFYYNTLKSLKPVTKHVLNNGLTVLVHESHEIPKVAFQLWYNVGSKDEELGEKGIAHLIEHMIFKGTNTLSESDINVLVHKLSGSCNAFTSYDFTGYTFTFPTHHWKEAFPITADCMKNCLFDDDMLNSEMKAVIQELKLYKDQYERSLIDELIGIIFPDHPYHYPIIGYKQDLWSVRGKDLLDFYKKHYSPNNATLVVVGDVHADEVFELAEKYFGAIPKDEDYHKKTHFFHKDIASKSISLYRAVTQPTSMYTFVVPGAAEKKDTPLKIFEWILGKGKSSRLYKKLVNDTQLATNVSTFFFDLFDYGVFFVMVELQDSKNNAAIEAIISAELEDLAYNGFQDDEFERGLKKTQMSFYSMIESIEDCAYTLGQSYLATGDEQYIFTALQQPQELLKNQLQEMIVTCFRPTIMHKGYILPLPEKEKNNWAELQEESDKEDQKILSVRERNTEVGGAAYANTIAIQNPNQFSFPHAQTHFLSNGLKVLYHNNPLTPKINLIVEFKARAHYDSKDQQGLYAFVTEMMTEGTEHYTGQELADEIESRGMSLNVYPGGISMKMLASDFQLGLQILKEVLMRATFPENEIEKIRNQLLSNIQQYWDEPRSFISHIVKQEIYKGHPYSKQIIGTKESVSAITRDDLINFYNQFISPYQARVAIVGDISNYDIATLLEQELSSWPSKEVQAPEYPALNTIEPHDLNYTINRDQVVLCLAQLSIDRRHPDFDKYLLFDQIFGGGNLNSMSSRLFDLREQTGLFYTIRGSLISGVDEQPGMFQVRTIVSLDRLAEAERVIKKTIDEVVDTLTEDDLEHAKGAIINTLVDNFATNSDTASTFLYVDRFNFPSDYFDTRAAKLNQITLDELKNAVKDILHSDKLLTVRVGRV